MHAHLPSLLSLRKVIWAKFTKIKWLPHKKWIVLFIIQQVTALLINFNRTLVIIGIEFMGLLTFVWDMIAFLPMSRAWIFKKRRAVVHFQASGRSIPRFISTRKRSRNLSRASSPQNPDNSRHNADTNEHTAG
jgi:hypothetical protein